MTSLFLVFLPSPALFLNAFAVRTYLRSSAVEVFSLRVHSRFNRLCLICVSLRPFACRF